MFFKDKTMFNSLTMTGKFKNILAHIFTAGYIVERAVSVTDHLCTKQRNSSIFGSKIHGL